MTKFGDSRIKYEKQNQQYISLNGLNNWIKCYLITDIELLEFPYKLINELGGHLQERWIVLNRSYYENQSPSSTPTAR